MTCSFRPSLVLKNLLNSLALSGRVKQTRPIAGILKRTHAVLKYVTVTGPLAGMAPNIGFGSSARLVCGA